MKVSIVITHDLNSPTQKVWGYICPENSPENAVVFYGPGTRQGASEYGRPHKAVISTFQKKINDGYSPLFEFLWDIDESISLSKAAEKILLGIQNDLFNEAIRSLTPKNVTSERIRSDVCSIQSPDWVF